MNLFPGMVCGFQLQLLVKQGLKEIPLANAKSAVRPAIRFSSGPIGEAVSAGTEGFFFQDQLPD